MTDLQRWPRVNGHETEIIEPQPGLYFGICSCQYVTPESDDENWVEGEIWDHVGERTDDENRRRHPEEYAHESSQGCQYAGCSEVATGLRTDGATRRHFCPRHLALTSRNPHVVCHADHASACGRVVVGMTGTERSDKRERTGR